MPENKIILFKNEEFGEVRTLNINGEPWFVGKDVCNLFGDKNHIRSLGRVDEFDKQKIELIDSMNRKQSATVINESGLYALLFAMQPQKAHNDGVSDEYPIEIQQRIDRLHKFKRWVTAEILPSLRKHGAYFTAETLHKTMSDPRELAKLLNTLADEQDKRKKLEEENASLSIKANYYDQILDSKNAVPVTQIAKDYGMSAVAFNKMLHEYRIQYPIRDSWVLYEEYADKGYTQSKTYKIDENRAVMRTHWTQCGRLFLYNFLKEKGVLPMCEREENNETVV